MTDSRHPYGEQAARHAADLAARTDSELSASTGGPLRLASICSALVLLLGFWLWLANPVLASPFTGTGWDTALRDEMVSVLVILAGLVLVKHPSNTPATVVAVAAGLGLLAFGVWAQHDLERMAANELLTGFAVIAAALVARLYRAP
ncbi:hypothetical protein [Nocardioides marmoribigeumensis]|jgi:hypothetical protein|uniref:Uncharacterized protein n=1 Tax=Nocardioides marmoribigeumensis TaxID=433649 RepID=A0ABU2BXQ9_9ACTN|nr:hypothetical protein [Nocardioides marmoribigeumensis]MDR7363196.1 hypothetical protein [Nocardioides marmoribigeumensis]